MEVTTTTITRIFNKKDQLIYEESTLGFETFFNYDPDHDKLIYERFTLFGGLIYEDIFTYNEKYKLVQKHRITTDTKFTTDYYYSGEGLLLFAEDGRGNIHKYNSNEKLIYEKLSNDLEIWHEYDDRGDKIHTKDSKDYKGWFEYDDNHNMILRKDSRGLNERVEYVDIHF